MTLRTKQYFLNITGNWGATQQADFIESVYPGVDVTTEVGVVFISSGSKIIKWNIASAKAPTDGTFTQTGYETGSFVYHTANDWWICTSDTPTVSTWKNLTGLNSIADTDVNDITATLSVIEGTDLKLLLQSIDTALAARPTSSPTASDFIDDDAGAGITDKSWSSNKLTEILGVAQLADTPDGKIITAGNSLSQQIIALDTAIESLQGEDGIGGDGLGQIVYSNSLEQLESGGGAADYYSFDGTSDWIPFVKNTNASKVRITFEGKSAGLGGGSPANVALVGGKMNAAGSGIEGTSVISSIKYITSTDYTTIVVEDDISKFDTGVNIMGLLLTPDDTFDMGVRNVVVEII